MCCTKRREDKVAVSNQLTVLSRTRKKNVPPQIVKIARQAGWPRIVSLPASSIVPCPTCNSPKLTSYERRSPSANAALLSGIAFSLGAGGVGDCADNATAAKTPKSSGDRRRESVN